MKTMKFDAFFTLLDSADRIAISGHVRPDGDCTGSALALSMILQHLGKEVIVYSKDPYPYNFDFIKGFNEISRDIPDKPCDLYIVVDAGAPDRVGNELYTHLLHSSAPIVLFDHHSLSDATKKFPYTVTFIDTEASATAEIIFALSKELSVPLHKELATALYAAIVSDSGRFSYSKTSAQTHRIAATLIDAGVSPWEISSLIYDRVPLNAKRYLAEVLQEMRLLMNNTVAIIELRADRMRYFGIAPDQVDGFVNEVRSIAGVQLAVRFREEKQNLYRVSLRSISEDMPAETVAVHFGGGGHTNAAAFVFHGSFEEGVQQLEDFLATL